MLDDDDLIPDRVLNEIIPPWRRDMHVPVFKYLRRAGHLDDAGKLKDSAAVDDRIVARMTNRESRLLPPSSGGYRARAKQHAAAAGDFARLKTAHEPHEALMALPYLPADAIDLDELRTYLKELREEQFVNGHPLQGGARGSRRCVYDWLRYGKA